MTAYRGQWSELWERAAEISTQVVELSALSGEELPGLLAALEGARPPFDYVAVHAPTKLLTSEDRSLALSLTELPDYVESIVLHPDVITQPDVFRPLGSRVVLENMDIRKPYGTSVSELRESFQTMPAAGFCLDLAHVASVDPSMRLGHDLLDAFGDRLRQVHVSTLDHDSHHEPLTQEDASRFAELLRRCGDVPIVLEAEPPEWMWRTR